MTEPIRIENLPAALLSRAFPTVTVWNRLEGRPRTTDFDRALRAEVRDALWLLTRQWQMGEFRSTDGGSPVTALYSISAAAPNRFRPGGSAAGVQDLPTDRPLETVATRRAVPFTFGADPVSFDLRLVLGRHWLKLLAADSQVRTFRSAYVDHYPIAQPDPTADSDTARAAHPEVWAGLQAVAGRRMDGYLLYRHIVDGGKASDGIPGTNQSRRTRLDNLGLKLVAWFRGLIDQPAGPASWDPRRLEHRFSIAAGDAASAGETVLTAPEHPGGEIDWHTFSLDPAAPLGGSHPPATTFNRTVFPAPVRFSGMPLARWWSIEDGRTNFAAVRPDSSDLARLIFLEFALVFSNDWFQLACDLPVGTIAQVQGLAVTDVFGQRLWITPAGTGAQQDWQRWSMFTVDTLGTGPAQARVILPPVTPQVATGPAREEVSLIRDENANLVWGIERTIALATGDSRRGAEVAAETVAHRRRLFPPPPPDAPHAAVAYDIMTTIPENWIPFIPVHVPGDTRSIQLQRAALPSEVDGQPVRPGTSLLREGLDAATPQAYFVNEEEVPQTGTTLTTAFHRARLRDGRVAVWLAVQRGTGRGPRSSGLAFDVLVSPTEPA